MSLNLNSYDYTIKEGDSLSLIAARVCRDRHLTRSTDTINNIMDEIMRNNAQIKHKDLIRIGNKLTLFGNNPVNSSNNPPKPEVKEPKPPLKPVSPRASLFTSAPAKTQTAPGQPNPVIVNTPGQENNSSAKTVAFTPSLKTQTVPNQSKAVTALTIANGLLEQKIDESGSYLRLTGGREEPWCTDTVNYIYSQANNGKSPFGNGTEGRRMSSVTGLMQWGQEKGLFCSTLQPSHYSDIEKVRKALASAKPGDLVVWKGKYKATIEGGKTVTRQSSHVGIVKEIINGKAYIVEGNANDLRKNAKGEYMLVHNKQEGINGNQAIGEFQEVNRYDSLAVKEYTPEDLCNLGMAGCINMQNV